MKKEKKNAEKHTGSHKSSYIEMPRLPLQQHTAREGRILEADKMQFFLI
jgi:hypothetical protein